MTGVAVPSLYQQEFAGRGEQVGRVRRELERRLSGHPLCDDVVLVGSELATNAILHSQSRARTFTVRCGTFSGYVRIEVEDLGGPWRSRTGSDRPHGLDIVASLAGEGNWGRELTADGGRVMWAELGKAADA